jgi:hypothetical protein
MMLFRLLSGSPRRVVPARALAETLVRDGLLEVISEVDFPNPHIRPWSSLRRVDEQVRALRAATEGNGRSVGLYPTATRPTSTQC